MKVIGFGAALVDKQFLIKDDALNTLGIEKGLMTLNSEEEQNELLTFLQNQNYDCLLYTSPSPRDKRQSRMPSSA